MHHWNQLPTEVLGTLPCKPITFKMRVREAITEVVKKKMKCVGNYLEMWESVVK